MLYELFGLFVTELSFLTADNDILSLKWEYFYCLIWESVFFQIIFAKIYHVLGII